MSRVAVVNLARLPRRSVAAVVVVLGFAGGGCKSLTDIGNPAVYGFTIDYKPG
jgi:hypothetical protein